MRKIALTVAVTAVLAGTALVASRLLWAPPAVALTGQVTSAREGPMEGVLVSAKPEGGTISVTVVSDAKGRFAFPASKIGPDHYNLKIRAVGYDLEGPKAVDVAAGARARADLRLVPTTDLAAQLSDAEWMESMPGTDDQKRSLFDCVVCHTVQRIVRSKHTPDEWVQVYQRMAAYSQGAIPERPQMRRAARPSPQDEAMNATADWMATINLSKGDTWSYPLKTFPRPKGRATRVVITEYDLPREYAQPHDVIVDSKGTAWYADFGEQIMGKLDPKTGKVTEYAVPTLKPGFPTGILEVAFDEEENIWLALMHQGGIAKFDPRTEKITAYPLPKEIQGDRTQESMVSPSSSGVDGKVWTNKQDDHSFWRLDVATGAWEGLGVFQVPGENRNIASYGMPTDKDNNVYILEYSAGDIGRIDAKTKAFTVYKTPTPHSQPRRGGVDAQGRVWFAEFGVNQIGMFDPTTEAMREWKLPTPWNGPYQALADNKGEAWSGAMLSDRIHRLNPKTGAITEYLLPRQTNVRRVWVDSSTAPSTFWVGNNHGASIIRLEPLD
jgi:streptogramin lyase